MSVLATAATWAATGTGALLALAALAPAFTRSRRGSVWFYGASALLSGALALLAGMVLLASPQPAPLALPLGLPFGRTELGWDALSAGFAALINLVATIVGVYAMGYGAHEPEPRRVLPFYAAFLAGMNLVLLSNDAFSFLVGWEFMSLASWALVVSQDRDAANRRAGFVYLTMAFGGTLMLLLAFGLLTGIAGGYEFERIRAAAVSNTAAVGALALAFAGTGSKAGLVPLHAWLPLAHPAAPSHVSALMSGVMTKVAVYGFARFAFDLAPPGGSGAGLGAVLIVLGAATAVFGVTAAALETDIKRCLAYSTIENIGLIFAALGLTLAFQSAGMQAAAALAFTTALLHIVNHALMKSLLFLGAGAVVTAVGARDLNAFGGLARRMPWTMGVMLVGAMAIAALPPLNGFVSEWLLLQSVLASPQLPGWLLKLLVPAAGAAFALATTVAAAVFIRLFGITFLGRARTHAAAQAHDTDRMCAGALATLAALCVLLGAMPLLAVEPLQHIVGAVLDTRLPGRDVLPWQSLVPLPSSASAYNGLIVLGLLAASGLLAAQVLRRRASPALRYAPVWDCGTPDADPATQYSADSFAQPLKRVLGAALFGATERVSMPPPGDTATARMESTWRDLAWSWGYEPLARTVSWLADRLNALQFLTIRRYLVMVFVALIVLLLAVVVWR